MDTMETMESMEDFEAMLEASFQQVNNGDLLEGTILEINGDTAIVDIGSYMDGLLTQDQLLYDGESMSQYPVGSRLKLVVLRVNTRESQILLSKKEADKRVIWDELAEKKEQQQSIAVKVTSAVKGGLRVQYKGVQGFMPASQVDVQYVEDLESYAGQELDALLLEITPAKREFTVSRKEWIRKAEKEAKQHAFQTLKAGDRLTGSVVKLEKYGAFVEIQPGVIGLLHVSDMAWSHVKHPADLVQVGDVVTVAVQEIDAERGRISLSLKAVEENPWDNLPFKVGEVLIAKPVTHTIASGAFVALTDKIEGFLPISQISDKRIQTVREVLKEGDLVNVLVRSIDGEKQRISLTMREVPQGDEPQVEMAASEYAAEDEWKPTMGEAFQGLDELL